LIKSNPAFHGGMLALAAAGCFGLSTPFLQFFGRGVGPFFTAALLYGGAALLAMFTRRSASREAAVQRSDLSRLLGMAFFGAVIGPVALAWGLQHTSGTSASLMLALEAVFTVALARLLYGETFDRRVALAMVILLVGGVVLVFDQRKVGNAQLLGLCAVLLATFAWGVDNTLSRGVADRDPAQVVLVKSTLGAVVSSAIGVLSGEVLPPPHTLAALIAVGATGYGLSLRFYLLAQRAFGAARTGSVFAFAPFIGALGAFVMGERELSALLLIAGALMLVGVVVHLAEQHDHAHDHAPLNHEHAHRHDDGHHDHVHSEMPTGTHSHRHTHAALQHKHPHAPDAHHLHTH
jgi:drug/metabolite transporter (DMT)-like permease